jgi:hypothetical protein
LNRARTEKAFNDGFKLKFRLKFEREEGGDPELVDADSDVDEDDEECVAADDPV